MPRGRKENDMGMDNGFSRPPDRTLWEQIKDNADRLNDCQQKVRELNEIVEKKEGLIKSLKAAIMALKGE